MTLPLEARLLVRRIDAGFPSPADYVEYSRTSLKTLQYEGTPSGQSA